MAIEQKIITPEYAQELLTLVDHPKQRAMQRPLQKSHIDEIVRLIKHRIFKDVGVIHLCHCKDDGLTYLINGQHTLNAVILTKIPVTLTIRQDTGQTIKEIREMYAATDNQGKRRPQDTHRAYNLHEELGLHLSDIDYISNAVTFIYSNFDRHQKKRGKISSMEMADPIRLYAQPYKSLREFIAGGDKEIVKRLNGQGYLSIALLTFKFQPEKAREFWGMVCHGTGGSRLHPASVLAKKMIRLVVDGPNVSEGRKRASPNTLARIAATLWNAYMDGKREVKLVKKLDSVALKGISTELAKKEIGELLDDTFITLDKNATDFSKIEFYPKPHLYKYEGNTPLTSVTKFVSSLHPPFDRQGIAEKKARELGIPIQQVLSNWSEAGQKGRELGTTVHDYIQQKLNGIAIDELRYRLNGSTPLELDAFDKYYDRIRQEGMHPTWVEQIIGDIDYKLAGKVDCLFLHPQDGYILVDWKTGKIEEWNTQKFNPPFEKIPCDDLYKYSFQLSLYKLIIERNTDIKISKMYIVHLFGDEYKVYPGIDYGPDLDRYLKGR